MLVKVVKLLRCINSFNVSTSEFIPHKMSIVRACRIVFFLCSSGVVLSFEDGAPETVCFSMRPGHKNTSAQNGPSPFNLTLSFNNRPDPPQIEVTLGSQDDKTPFKGFLIEARSGLNQSVVIGSFLPNNKYQLLNCSGGINNAATHIENKPKLRESFIFVPEANYTGHFTFRSTVVKDYQTYWIGVTSPAVSVVINNANPFHE